MAGRQAKILSNTEIKLLLLYARRTRNPLRNRVIVLLSAKAGLRAGEISSLNWDMVLDPSSQVGNVIELWNEAAKKGSGRIIQFIRISEKPCKPCVRLQRHRNTLFSLNEADEWCR